MKRISLFISEPQYAAFQALGAARGRPYAELVREALEAYLGAQAPATVRPPRRNARPASSPPARPVRPRRKAGRS